jgi:hypothetical protein
MTLLDPAARSEPLTEDQIEIEWMRWNLPADSGDAMAFYRLGEPERIRKAFVDGLLRGAAVVAQSPIPAARLEPIPGGVAEKLNLLDVPETERLKLLYAVMDYGTESAQNPYAPPGEAFDKVRSMLGLGPGSLPSSTPGLDPKGQNSEEAPCSTFDACEGGHPLLCMNYGCQGGLDPIRSSDGEVKGG